MGVNILKPCEPNRGAEKTKHAYLKNNIHITLRKE